MKKSSFAGNHSLGLAIITRLTVWAMSNRGAHQGDPLVTVRTPTNEENIMQRTHDEGCKVPIEPSVRGPLVEAAWTYPGGRIGLETHRGIHMPKQRTLYSSGIFH